MAWSCLGAWLMVVACNALFEVLPVGLTSAAVSDRYFSAFTPAGFTFSIWGVIYLALGAAAFVQLGKRSAALAGFRVGYLLTSLLNVLWLLAFQTLHLGLSLLIMLALLASLAWMYLLVRRSGLIGTWARLPISLYLGWISVATIANMTIVLLEHPWLGHSSGPAWASLLILVAALLGAVMSLRYRDLAFNAVLLWAFSGIFSAQAAPAEHLALAVGAALVALGAWLARTRPGDRLRWRWQS